MVRHLNIHETNSQLFFNSSTNINRLMYTIYKHYFSFFLPIPKDNLSGSQFQYFKIKYQLFKIQLHLMSLEQQIEDQEDVQRYLNKKNIHEIMHEMVEQLMINKPADPVNFLISHLKQSDRKVIVLIGPPGLHLYNIIQKAIGEKINIIFSSFNSGEYLMKEASSLPQNAKQKIKISRMVDDQKTNTKLVGEIAAFCKKQNHALIEGFPKSLKQALSLHEKGICPDKVIFVNADSIFLKNLCKAKIKENTKQIDEQSAQKLAEDAASEYLMNIKQLKLYYPSFLEIDAGSEIQEHNINYQIQRLLNLKFGSIQPRRNTRIVIMGAPCSGRTTVGKKIAAKYNLIYVSTSILITQEIRKGTVTGRKIKEAFDKKQVIDNFQIEKLIEERISKKDCQMQGYVLEGYPKTKQQWENMQNMHIYPDFIIGINPPEWSLLNRAPVRQNPQFPTRYERWQKMYDEILKDKKEIFWVSSDMSAENYFEDICFEIENHKVSP